MSAMSSAEHVSAEPRAVTERVDDLGRGSRLTAAPWFAIVAARARMRVGMDLLDGLGPLGLTLRGYTLLEIALEAPALSQRDLATRIAFDERQVVHLVTELERAGFVERIESPSDRRVRNVRVTDLGRDAVDRAREIVEARQSASLARLTTAERAMLVELLAKVGPDV